ncbi:MAG: RNA polymerase sigma factor [Armatimonadetes bacterium]|nr:RNA polymerase sigma factor [Armatimonadota bacterium]
MELAQEEEDGLMCSVQRGDAGAFDALATRLRTRLASRIGAIVRDPGASDDVLQETLLRIWTHASQWDRRAPVQAWAARVATNLAINHLRSVRRRREDPLAYGGPDLTAGSCASPHTHAEATDEHRRIRDLMSELPRGKRQVLAMACEDMSVREIAERLALPEGTVKSRLHHARRWLAARWDIRENEGKDMR